MTDFLPGSGIEAEGKGVASSAALVVAVVVAVVSSPESSELLVALIGVSSHLALSC